MSKYIELQFNPWEIKDQWENIYIKYTLRKCFVNKIHFPFKSFRFVDIMLLLLLLLWLFCASANDIIIIVIIIPLATTTVWSQHNVSLFSFFFSGQTITQKYEPNLTPIVSISFWGFRLLRRHTASIQMGCVAVKVYERTTECLDRDFNTDTMLANPNTTHSIPSLYDEWKLRYNAHVGVWVASFRSVSVLGGGRSIKT